MDQHPLPRPPLGGPGGASAGRPPRADLGAPLEFPRGTPPRLGRLQHRELTPERYTEIVPPKKPPGPCCDEFVRLHSNVGRRGFSIRIETQAPGETRATLHYNAVPA